MKKLFKTFILATLILGGMWSCKKQENRVVFTGGTSPVLTASVTGTIPLSFVNKDNEALQLFWTNPNYQFNTGTSSLNVNYNIEIDTTGANFTNPNKKVLSLGTDLSKTFTQGELNDYLLNQLLLTPASIHNIQIRVTSFLVGGAEPLVSNVLSFQVTPFSIPPKVTPPGTPVGNPPTDWINGHLYIVGNATPGGDATGWNNPVPVPSQEFTKVTSTFYTITIALIGNKNYLFLPVNGSWSAKYGAIGANSSNNPNGDDFRAGGGDFISPVLSGTYRIDVDFQRGKFTVTKI